MSEYFPVDSQRFKARTTFLTRRVAARIQRVTIREIRTSRTKLYNHYTRMAALPSTYPDPIRIAVIGGTGLSELPQFTYAASLSVETPWGPPASPIAVLEHPSPSTGKPIPVAFLARHGIHHQLAPHEVPARANIAALRSIGVRTIIAFSAVGSLREEVKPRDFVVPDQIIDRTKSIRPFTFFEGGMVVHVPFADPFDDGIAKLVRLCGHSLEGEGVKLHDVGTVVCMGMMSSRDQNAARLMLT